MKPTRSLITHITFACLMLALLAGCAGAPAAPAVTAANATPVALAEFTWPTSTPEEEGIDPAALAEALQIAQEKYLGLHSLLVVRHGKLVSETYFAAYQADTPHPLYSVTKSFTSTLVGIAIEQGLLVGVDRPVLDYFPGMPVKNQDAQKTGMTLEDLLTMTSGLDWQEGDPFYNAMYMSEDWVRFVMNIPMRADPGEEFNYCSGCSHVLSAVLQHQVGMSTLEYADRNLFRPLGISNYTWDADAQGIAIGGWGLSLTPRDMAKLGQLFLQGGVWQGRQVVPAAWVSAATDSYIGTGGNVEYGYQWWVDPAVGSYSARGRYGQVVYVVPEKDLVVVVTAQASDDDPIYVLIEDVILPGIGN